MIKSLPCGSVYINGVRMNRIKVVLIGGEYDLTRMMIEDRGGCPLEMPERLTQHVIARDWTTDKAREAVCQILHYHRTVKVYGDTWIYEYRPNE